MAGIFAVILKRALRESSIEHIHLKNTPVKIVSFHSLHGKQPGMYI